MDKELNEHLSLTSANSINVARFLPPGVLLFLCICPVETCRKGGQCSDLCTCGNFGNITAGLFGKRWGLPVKRLLPPTTVMIFFYQYLQTGKYSPRPSIATIASAMDVGDPITLPVCSICTEGSHAAISARFRETHLYRRANSRDSERDLERSSYLLDPHGACGYRALMDGLQPGVKPGILGNNSSCQIPQKQ